MFYPRTDYEFQNWYYPLLPKEPFTLLDLGCGNQQRSRHFNFSKCTAVDVDENHRGKGHPDAEFICSDTIEFLQKDKTIYDVVFAAEVIEHQFFKIALDMIKLMKARTGKLLIIVTPDGFAYNIHHPEFEELCSKSMTKEFLAFSPYDHRCGFTQDQYEFLGFEVKRYINGRGGMKARHDEYQIPYPPSFDRLMAYWRP